MKRKTGVIRRRRRGGALSIMGKGFILPGSGLRLAGQGRPRKIKNTKRVVAGKKAAKKNKWLKHVKNFIRTHPSMKYKQALKLASKTYV